MKARMKDMVRVATARLGGEQQAGAASSGYGRRESMAARTARLGGDSLRRQPQPQAPTVRTVYCNDREANAPVGYKVGRTYGGLLPFHRSVGWISWVHTRFKLGVWMELTRQLGNSVSTTKYSVLTFLPKGLFEQQIWLCPEPGHSKVTIMLVIGFWIFFLLVKQVNCASRTPEKLTVMMNSMNVPSKRSTLEKKLDKLILALFATLFTMCHWCYWKTIGANITCGCQMIKFIQCAQFINNDLNMYHAESDTPALARTSNLNEG
ncbi:hypothetical protein PR202_ga00210 [Eleusine coracana subsp. coracana]|uniref:P-type ATPase N-terminal domain-containing protein n=1 Tax=Eleusine coracana subsp. coracana TaxID=191504 RepID=A0AAV5BFX8_ELECO|nr:hypothetical protein PR202_ga00210 [Eleusine coracana subsp. coracana]